MIWTLILAAGQGSRLSAATGGRAKQFLDWQGVPLYWHSALLFTRGSGVAGLVFVFPEPCVEAERVRLAALMRGCALPWKVVAGGVLRQDSVRHGLAALPETCTQVLIHDAARPFASPALVSRVIEALSTATGVVPGVPVTDTIKVVRQGLVDATPDRSALVAVQTPQGFDLAALREAHTVARREGWIVTDDASLLERCGQPVRVVDGELENRKITTPEDLEMLVQHGESTERTAQLLPCVGYGYDVHRYATEEHSGQPARPMRLGGVFIPDSPAVIAHSDGDVLVHALMDAMLGCVGGGDIGQHFPDTDPTYENASSVALLEDVRRKVEREGFCMTHVDLTLIAQIPRIGPYREAIRNAVAGHLQLAPASVNVKATTEERLGFTGACLGIKAVAVVTGLRREVCDS